MSTNTLYWLDVPVLQGGFLNSCPYWSGLPRSLLQYSIGQSQVFIEGAPLQLATTPHFIQLNVRQLVTLISCFFLLK